MKMYSLPTIISILLIFSTSLFAQNTSILPVMKDNSMFNESGTKSLGEGKIFAGQTCQGNIRRALIQFDISAIPSGAMVTNVELKLGAEKSRGMGDGIIDIHAVTQDWGEGTSFTFGGGGNGAPAVAPDATWTDAMLGTSFWSTPGGDYDPILLSSRVTTEEFQTISFPSSANFAAQVEAWAADPSSNFGILIIGVEGTDCSTYRFGSKDIGTAPELVVTWENGCEPNFTNLFITTCDEYITGGGTVLDQTGTYTEILTDIIGCDSTIIIDLTVLPPSELLIDETLCAGQTFTLEGIVFDENNPSGEIFYQAVNGCDSIVTIDLAFESNPTIFINETLCFGESILVNGTLYDELNPMGCETLISENGCDSIICVDLTFFPQSMSTETYIGCEGDGYTVVVNGTTYSELNPNGVELLEAVDVNGCDSIVIVDLIFVTPPNAGTATGPLDMCNDEQGIVDLNTLLTGADLGGDWSEISTVPSTGFSGDQFDGDGQIPATYIFRYTVSSTICGDVLTEVMINVAAPNTATVTSVATICNNNNNGNSSQLDFNSLITAGFTGGVWFDVDGVGVDLSNLCCVDFTGVLAPSTWTFEYRTPANNGCPAQTYPMVVVVEDCICPPIMTNENYTGCEEDGYEVIVNGVVYNAINPIGVETMTSFNTGCDSIVTVNLVFYPVATSAESFGTCDITIPPFFTEIIEGGAFSGCDSVINFSTIYFPTDEIFLVATTCNSDEVGTEVITLINTNGCDSIITITTEFLPTDSTEIFTTSCDPDDAGIEVTTLVSSIGCDSVVTTTTVFEPLDNGVIVEDNTITALLAGAEYEWIECDTAFVIQDANEQSFTAPVTGNYAVIIRQDGCMVTSECNFIDLVNTEDAWFKNQLSIMPNPTRGDFRLDFGDLENLNIRIVDLTGRVMEAKQNLRGGSEELRIEGPAGVYFVEVELEGVRTWLKVVKVK